MIHYPLSLIGNDCSDFITWLRAGGGQQATSSPGEQAEGLCCQYSPGTCSGHGGPSCFQVPEKVLQNLSTKRASKAVCPLTLPSSFPPFALSYTEERLTPAHAYPHSHGGAAESRNGLLGFTRAAKGASTNKMWF